MNGEDNDRPSIRLAPHHSFKSRITLIFVRFSFSSLPLPLDPSQVILNWIQQYTILFITPKTNQEERKMSRGPPQLMFDDGSRVMVEDSERAASILDRGDGSSSLPPTQRGSIPLHSYYEIDRMSREVIDLLVKNNGAISDGSILRVAIQFPDELLEDSPEVCWLLEDKIREDLELACSSDNSLVATVMPFCFVLGDTTVNAGCPDEVAALHLNADVLIHYGHACLSPTERLPVLYSFGKLDFDDIDGAVQTLEEARKERKVAVGSDGDNQYNNYLLLYQLGYHHAMKDLQQRWMEMDGDLNIVLADIPEMCKPHNQKPKIQTNDTISQASCCQTNDENVVSGESGGCCGNDSGSALVNNATADETAKSSCCKNENESTCNVPVSSATIINEPAFNDINNKTIDKARPLVVGGLELPLNKISTWEDLSNYTVIFIMGNPEEDADNYSTDDVTTLQQRQYANSMLCFLSLPHGEPGGGYMIYSPKHKELRKDVSPPPSLRRQLKRRFFLTQKAKDANVFGILVSNLSQQHLVNVVKSLQKIIQDSDRTAYSFAVGKINPAKLANFAEIETFVIVASPEHSLLDNEREYPIPVITPMELEIALDKMQWGMQAYSLDCQDFMLRRAEDESKENEGEDAGDEDSVDSDAPYFSMVTGRYESRKQKGSREHDLDLQALPGKGQVTEYKSEAANFLRQREYQGLESKVGQTEVKAAVLGMRGIASDYRTETNSED